MERFRDWCVQILLPPVAVDSFLSKGKHCMHNMNVAEDELIRYISSVQLTKEAPRETCCIRDATQEVVTGHYGTRLNPIVILDAQTLLLQRFTIEGSKPPDAWIYAGRGEINQDNGKKAFIVGRDTPEQ
ncbi:hypothetical protein Y032_0892g2900 [Ancylostoma ceylanicum]|nr:hypothetical protein Y032_0892g2900 [Ancylostoma ceylanicum]